MNQKFYLGIDSIDRQHDELFRRMDRLLEACISRSCNAEAEEMLEFLDEYVVTHFAAEEGLQRVHMYPGYENHRLLHTAFISNMAFIKSEIGQKGLTDSVIQHVNHMLIEWFSQHVLEQDRDMSDYLAAARKENL